MSIFVIYHGKSSLTVVAAVDPLWGAGFGELAGLGETATGLTTGLTAGLVTGCAAFSGTGVGAGLSPSWVLE